MIGARAQQLAQRDGAYAKVVTRFAVGVRAVERKRDHRCDLILVANLDVGGSTEGKPSALVRQKHIHTTVHHAGQRPLSSSPTSTVGAAYRGPAASPKSRASLGLTLTTSLPTAPPPPLHGGPSSCWCYAAQEQVFGRTDIPGIESARCHNFIATRHSGAIFLERMPNRFYENLPQQAYDGRFVCCKARWCKQPAIDWPHAGAAAAAEWQPSHFFLATWHGPHTR